MAGNICAYCASTTADAVGLFSPSAHTSGAVQMACSRSYDSLMRTMVGTDIGDDRTPMHDALNIVGKDGWRPYARVNDGLRDVIVWVSRDIPTRVEYAEVRFAEDAGIWYLCIPGREATELSQVEIEAVVMAAADGWHLAGSSRDGNHIVTRLVPVP